MKLFELNTESNFNEIDLCLAVGNFDGVHKGHQHVIKKLVEISKKKNLKSTILSFNPHPRDFFKKSKETFNIITKKNKRDLFKKYDISIYIDFKFDLNLSSLSATEFIENIIIKKLKTKIIVIGEDFRFGKDRLGDLNLLKKLSLKYNFEVIVLSHVKIKKDSEKFSSSIIREQIKNGLFEDVNMALGRPWQMKGNVIKGDQRAQKINFPTANILPAEHILPRRGVYCVNAYVDNTKYFGIANFGKRPTVDGINIFLETHIFDFNEIIYGKELTVEFLTFIRPEQKFKDFKNLTEQIQKDIIAAKKYHNL